MNITLIKRIFKISTVLFILFAIVLTIFQQTPFFNFSKHTFITLISSILALTIYTALGIKFHKLIYGFPLILVMIISFVSTLPLIIITVLYMLPIIIALSTENKPYIAFIALSTIAGFIIYKATYDYKSISYTQYTRLQIILGQGIPFICEVVIICYSAIPFVSAFDSNKKRIKEYNENLKKSEVETVKFCTSITSYHSAYLRIHTGNVETYTKFILDHLAGTKYAYLNDKDHRSDILFGARLHDIGKCYISDSLLDKNTALTKEEFEIIMQHTTKGRELFDELPAVSLSQKTRQVCRDIIYYHHERLDGNGYPEGLVSVMIPVEAKLVAVADVTDALLSFRSYKAPFTKEEFLKEMEVERDFKLDGTFIDIITENIDQILEIAALGNEQIKKEKPFQI